MVAIRFLIVLIALCLFKCTRQEPTIFKEKYLIDIDAEELRIDGRYLPDQENVNQTFWLCVDYETLVTFDSDKWSPYPVNECGGPPNAQQNVYWYAFHGRWEDAKTVQINLTYAASVPFKGFRTLCGEDRYFTGNGIQLPVFVSEDGLDFRLYQQHGISRRQNNPNMDTLMLKRYSEVRSVSPNSKIQVRLQGVGLKITEVHEENIAIDKIRTPDGLFKSLRFRKNRIWWEFDEINEYTNDDFFR